MPRTVRGVSTARDLLEAVSDYLDASLDPGDEGEDPRRLRRSAYAFDEAMRARVSGYASIQNEG